MEYYIGNISCDADFLSHHGILGMKWGIRRYQNKDGSLTEEGRVHRQNNGSSADTSNSIKSRISNYRQEKAQKREERESRYDPDYKSAHSKKPIEEMSTKELTAINNRLNQERLYKLYTSRSLTGKKIVNNMIASGLSEPSRRELKANGMESVIDILTMLAIWFK